MALRAFHANPSIGGFGNENVTTPLFLGNPRTNDTSNKGTDLVEESGDALCQIAKELVDNAVDACETARRRVDNTKVYRVKVEILPYHNGDSHDIPGNSECGTMQIIVSDNGCGMKDIQACVNAFQTTKTKDTDTAGRYGIGLTLCLLHAQRLVPGTYSCITSATRDAKNFKRALYFVDTVRDAVECHREEQVAKSVTDESGTCVSVLIPGGSTAKAAWPRLSSYIRRFQLSSVECSIEVLAPTLSTAPIHILRRARISFDTSQPDPTSDMGPLEEALDNPSENSDDESTTKTKKQQAFITERKILQNAAHKYGFFRLPIKLQNVAHSEHRIRIPGMTHQDQENLMQPKLAVDVVVSPHEGLLEDANGCSPTACLELVRMVNSVPLLDGAESFACGLVKALQCSVIWSSFGLSMVGSAEADKASCSNQYAIRDSDQVAPFFRSHTHQQWEAEQKEFRNYSDEPADAKSKRNKRSRGTAGGIMPAKVRLGKLLLLVNIRAAPSKLPLPSLSKGRLPINHLPISQAFHLGLRECLKSLQISSPGLLLTAAQLRTVERDVRYIPLMANAAAGILGRMPDRSKQHSLIQKVQDMRIENESEKNKGAYNPQEISMAMNEILQVIICRTSNAIQAMESAKKQKKSKVKPREKKGNSKDDFGDIESSDDESCSPDWEQTVESTCQQLVQPITMDSQSVGNEVSSAEESSSHSSANHGQLSGLPNTVTASHAIDENDDDWW